MLYMFAFDHLIFFPLGFFPCKKLKRLVNIIKLHTCLHHGPAIVFQGALSNEN
jgi:hypothetical protein